MYQASHWNECPMYQAVMTRHNEDIYVHDFVMYSHPAAGNVIGRIEMLYVNVSISHYSIFIICSIKTVLLCWLHEC